MKQEPTRRYRMTARAEAAAQTARRILESTVALWREHALDEITLQAIADRADVSVQTVIRRFGSKEGVFEATIERGASGIEAERDRAPVGDVDEALRILLAHYERDGDAVLRTLALEDRLDVARRVAESGRASHRAWCARVFAPWVPETDSDTHIDAFVAATDLYLWKLLRRDLGRSAEDTARVFHRLVDGLRGR